MKVSVLLPVLRPGPALETLMRALMAQSLRPDDIWVAETEPSAGTEEMVRALGGRYVPVAAGRFDHAGTRTLLAREARADRVVMLSQDVILVQTDALERLLEALDRGASAAYGRQLAGPGADPFAAFKRSFLYPAVSREWTLADRERAGFDALAFSNAFSAYRTDHLSEIGWFGERRLMCEDISATAALLLRGRRIAYVAEATVVHPQDHTLGVELRRYFDIGAVHAMDPSIVSEFTGPRRKGLRFTRLGLEFLWKNHPARVPEFAVWCALKWIAYSLGRRSALLPRRVCASLSGLPEWWTGQAPARSSDRD